MAENTLIINSYKYQNHITLTLNVIDKSDN